jgi:rhodanese-related sulfurtransferase
MSNAAPDVPQVTPSRARALLDDGALLLDVREDDEWSAGHAAGAMHVPLGQVGSVELPRDRSVVVVCRSGGRSSKAVTALSATGVQAVNFEGGMTAWAAAGFPMVAAGGAEPQVI